MLPVGFVLCISIWCSCLLEFAPGEKKLHGAVFAEGIPNKSSFAEARGSNLSKNRAAEANG